MLVSKCPPKRRLFPLAAFTVAAGVGTTAGAGPQVGTVFVIAMENHNWTQPGSQSSPQQISGNSSAPYINSLVNPASSNSAQVSFASNYLNVGTGVHPSEPSYMWAEAGTDFGIHSYASPDNDPYVAGGDGKTTNQNTVFHLTGLMQIAGVSWKSYQENANVNSTTGAPLATNQWTVPQSSKTGSYTVANQYNGSKQYDHAPKHDPMVLFSDTNGGKNANYADPTTNPMASKYAPLQQLSADLTNNTVAKYNWITPNQFNDMHSTLSGGYKSLTGDAANIKQGDDFLAAIIPSIMASQAYQNNGAIIIWNDESEGGDGTDRTLMEIVISPLAKGNAYNSTIQYTHSSDLRTMQEIFNIGSSNSALTGGKFLNDANNATDLSDLFVSGAIPSAASVTNLVPEPGCVAVLGFTIAALTARRRRKI